MTPRKRKFGASLCWTVLALLLTVTPNIGWGQTNAPAPLPPAAQEALNTGILAAKVPDYLLAIQYFEEARKFAPPAPIIYLNLGLAESKIQGRELRAIAWFGAYLAAYPDAPNAAAVKEQIAVLEARNESNISRFLKTVQDVASQMPGTERQRVFDDATFSVVDLWTRTGNFAAAIQVADSFHDPYYKSWVQRHAAAKQAKTGDTAGAHQTFLVALHTLELIRDAKEKQTALHQIAKEQAEAGDLAAAILNAERVNDPSLRYSPQFAIALALAETGDVAAARRALAAAKDTADKAGDPWKGYYRELVTKVEARLSAGQPANAKFPTIAPPAVSAADWVLKNDKQLNEAIFKDLSGWVKTLPSDDGRQIFRSLEKAATAIIAADKDIRRMIQELPKK